MVAALCSALAICTLWIIIITYSFHVEMKELDRVKEVAKQNAKDASDLFKRYRELNTNFDALHEDYLILQDKYDELKIDYSHLENEHDSLEVEYKGLEFERNQLEHQLDMAEAHIERLHQE